MGFKFLKSFKIVILTAFAMALLMLASCGSNAPAVENTEVKNVAEATEKKTRKVVDMKGVEVEIPEQVNTFVESWFAHNAVDVMLRNAEGMLVTCCDEPTYQWMYKVCDNMSKAKFAKFSDSMNLEEIISLNPDVVFGSNEKYREMFTNVGIPFVNCMFTNYDEMKKSIRLTAEVFGGAAIDKADKYISYLDSKLAEVKAVTDTVPEDKRTTIVHGSSVYKMGVDGRNTIINDWIGYSGGVNAAANDIDGNLQTMTMEQLLLWDPDVIITGDTEDEVAQIMADEAWKNLKAVKNNRVYANPKGIFAWDRYGVEEALQFQWCSQKLYPELFKDFDIKAELKNFYKDFLNYDLTDSDAEKILRHQNP
ncbi:MAG: ABC transporter substrate-binding protein [Lachnospiraceae bacterium]|nr:ABC transporter substrate-binding protein [Lachnospiraceae bacterium]